MCGSVSNKSRRRLAIILSGGGARGAYEAGVLWYLFDELTRLRGAPPRVDILCGTSVGAINSAFVAAHLSDPVLGVRRLVDVWSGLRLDRVLGFGMRQALSLPRVLMGGGQGTGREDPAPPERSPDQQERDDQRQVLLARAGQSERNDRPPGPAARDEHGPAA